MVFQCCYILFLHVVLQSIFRSFIGSRDWQDCCFLCCYIYLFIVIAVNFRFIWQLDIFNLCLEYKLVNIYIGQCENSSSNLEWKRNISTSSLTRANIGSYELIILQDSL